MARSYNFAFGLSVALHGIIGVVLLSSLQWHKPAAVSAAMVQPTVKAEAIDLASVEAEIKRVENIALQKKQREAQQLKQQIALAAKAKRERLREQKRVRELEQQQAALKRQQQQKRQQLQQEQASTQQRRQQEERNLKQLKNQQNQARRRLAELTEQQKRAAEAAKRAAAKAKEDAALAAKKREAQRAEQALADQARARREKVRHVSELDRYQAMIREAIRTFWVVPENVDATRVCQLRVRVAPGGDILDVQLVKPSGSPVLDHSARAAVLKASPLPVPDNPVLFDQFREFYLTVRPTGVESTV